MRLQRHNARRRKKAAERPSAKKMALSKAGRPGMASYQQQAAALAVPKQSQRLAAKAARAGNGAQRSGSDPEDAEQLLSAAGGEGAHRRIGEGLLPDPSTWPFAALRSDSIADGDDRQLQVLFRPDSGLQPRLTLDLLAVPDICAAHRQPYSLLRT
jgi:hypothetical protein